jgi:hypothetical protein
MSRNIASVYKSAADNALFAGINALAEYTMINGDVNMCYAISEEELKSSCIISKLY